MQKSPNRTQMMLLSGIVGIILVIAVAGVALHQSYVKAAPLGGPGLTTPIPYTSILNLPQIHQSQ